MAKKIKLRAYINYLNIKDEDVDVCVDGIDSIAYCVGHKLTEEGKKYFKDALDKCYIEDYDNVVMWDEDDTEDEDGIPTCAYLAWELFAAFAGYCSCSDFDKWFVAD